MRDVAFYEVFQEERILLKKFLNPRIKAVFFSKILQEECHKNPPAKLVCIRTQSKIPASWLNSLDGVLSRSEGCDHLQNLDLMKQKVSLGCLSGYCSRAVAEHAIAVMLALLKKLKRQTKQFETFDRNGLTGTDCFGKNVLVVGVGKIGRDIVSLARGLSMRVKGVDLLHRVRGLKYTDLKSGIAWADVIFCALPLTAKTRGILNEKLLRKIKKGSFFINISRGEIAPLAGLQKLLRENVLAGIGLDVFENEDKLAVVLRSSKSSSIVSFGHDDRVILTPHNAFNSREALVEKSRQTAQAIEQFLKHKKFPHVVPRA